MTFMGGPRLPHFATICFSRLWQLGWAEDSLQHASIKASFAPVLAKDSKDAAHVNAQNLVYKICMCLYNFVYIYTHIYMCVCYIYIYK